MVRYMFIMERHERLILDLTATVHACIYVILAESIDSKYTASRSPSERAYVEDKVI